MKITSSKAAIRRRNIKAADEGAQEDAVVVEPEAEGVMFEAEDVAELLSEVTGEQVDVEAADGEDAVVFTVGEDSYTVEPDEDTEVLEMTRVNKKPVAGSRRVSRKPVSASKKVASKSRVVRRISK